MCQTNEQQLRETNKRFQKTTQKKQEDTNQDIVTILKLSIRVLALAALLVYLICCALGIIDIPEGVKFEMPFSE